MMTCSQEIKRATPPVSFPVFVIVKVKELLLLVMAYTKPVPPFHGMYRDAAA